MPRFFVSSQQILQGDGGYTVTVCGDDAHHISHSLRMAVGDGIVVCPVDGPDAGRVEYHCRLTQFSSAEVTAEAGAGDVRICRTEPPYAAHLYVALSKADKMETVIQKAVECGVGRIVPFVSSRCIARPGDGETKKQLRRQKIAAEAAKQCGRGLIPEVCTPISYAAMLKEAASADLPLFFYEGEGTVPLSVLLARQPAVPARIALVIGAEGGFSPEEVNAACEAGLIPAGLGTRILRCETAPIYALSCLSYAYELSPGKADAQNSTK